MSFFLTFTTYTASTVVRLNRSFFPLLSLSASLLYLVFYFLSFVFEATCQRSTDQCLAHASHDEGRGSFSAELSKCAININTRNDNYSGRCCKSSAKLMRNIIFFYYEHILAILLTLTRIIFHFARKFIIHFTEWTRDH